MRIVDLPFSEQLKALLSFPDCLNDLSAKGMIFVSETGIFETDAASDALKLIRERLGVQSDEDSLGNGQVEDAAIQTEEEDWILL